MDLYCQYHNVENERLLLTAPPFTDTMLSIHTRWPRVQHATGNILLIAGRGRPRRYVGFRCINDLPFARTLTALAGDRRPPGDPSLIGPFLDTLWNLVAGDSMAVVAVEAARRAIPPVNPQRGIRALSIRQPHAEAILRGVKTVEYRSGPTRIRGSILIYASQRRYAPAMRPI